MKRTMERKNKEKPQPTWVIVVRFFRSELDMVTLGGACKKSKN